jgi:formylglycine-generating enzyme required for sulfatase activity
MTRHLDIDIINNLVQALVEAAMATRDVRESLLAGIHPGYVSTLPERQNIQHQLRSDLDHMNRVDSLERGEVPLKIWLANALHSLKLAGRTEQTLFQQALDAVTSRAQQAPSCTPPPPPGPSSVLPQPPSLSVPHLSFEPETVPISAGPFFMGSSRPSDRQGHEYPQHEVILPAFRMGRYPVTNAQYAFFVQSTGYDPPDDWVEESFPAGKADAPVVYVSWYDARAYLDWLRQETGRPYRLPTEAEWEKAARGGDGRLWPWGNLWDPACTNCKPAGPGETTPVGYYSPAGDSPYDCCDMAGNVLEWTVTLFGSDWEFPEYPYPYDPADGRESLAVGDQGFRILRGGSYISHVRFVRCTCRYWNLPRDKDWYLGFRVALGARSPGTG